jgi:hypothetical protein
MMRNALHRRMVRAAAVCVPLLASCYEYAPMETSAARPGETVSFDITDQGRMALSDRFGPGLARVEGQVVRVDADQLVVNVYSVAQLSGQKTMWSGETTSLQRSYLGTANGRQFSRSRTAIAAVGAVGVLGALIASVKLSGSFSGSSSEPVTHPPVSIRIPVGHRP